MYTFCSHVAQAVNRLAIPCTPPVLLLLLLMGFMGLSQPCDATNIQNMLWRTAPTNIAECTADGAKWGGSNSYGVTNSGTLNYAGSIMPGFAIGTNASGGATATASGRLGYTDFTCVHSGYYDISASGLLNGMVGINVPKADTWLGGAEAEVQVYVYWKVYNQNTNAVLRNGGTVLFDQFSKHTTAAPTVFSNHPWYNTATNVYLEAGQTYACEISINMIGHVGAIGIDGHSAHAVAIFSNFIVPKGPYYGLYFGSYSFVSAIFTDKNPDYLSPVTMISPGSKICCSPQAIWLGAVDYGSYGLDKTYYRLNDGPLQEYTGPFTVASTTNIKYYSADRAGNIEGTKSADYVFPGMPPAPVAAINVGYTTIDISWMPVPDATSYYMYRDGIFMAEVATTSWTDTSPGWDEHTYRVRGVNTCYNGVLSNIVTGACTPPYVILTGGEVNGVPVSGGILELTVYDGDPVVGDITLEAYNVAEHVNIAPLVLVWGWGAHESGWSSIHPWIPQGISSYNVPINLTAPTTGGEYYLSTAFGLEIQGLHVASLTNWQVPGAPHWNDGYDMADWGSAEYAQSLAEHQVTTMYEGTGGFHESILPAAMIKLTVIERGTISGTVAEVAGPGLLGIPVDLYEGNTMIATTSTDGNGDYAFEELIPGDYFVSILTPLGYLVDAGTKNATVPPGGADVVNFALTRRDIVPAQEGIGYWKHQANLAYYDPDYYVDLADSMCTYMERIHQHFNLNPVYPITGYEYDASRSCLENLESIAEQLTLHTLLGQPTLDPTVAGDATGLEKPSPEGDKITMRDRAVQQFITLLLNVVSDRLALFTEVTEDGMTVSQTIIYCDHLINDPMPPMNLPVLSETFNLEGDVSEKAHEVAKCIAEWVNLGYTLPAGVIPSTTPDIAYRDEDNDQVPSVYSLSQNVPNPFNPATDIQFALPEDGHVRLGVFDVTGRRVATLVDGYRSAGIHTVRWDGRDHSGASVATGVYFYRMQSETFVETKKMLLLK